MDLEKEVLNQKEAARERIKAAIERGDDAAILNETRVLEGLVKISKQLSDAKQGLEWIKDGGRKASEFRQLSESARAIGLKRSSEIRDEFFNVLRSKGRSVSHMRRTLYEIDKKLVGIAYASERPSAPNRWFLGLPAARYDAFILLCEDEYKKSTRFIFPKTFYEKYCNYFSKDKSGGQMKFNITLRGDRYTIQIPGFDDININQYIDAFDHI
jgi:hypothetical protein